MNLLLVTGKLLSTMTKSVGTESKSTILMQSIWTLTSNSLAFLPVFSDDPNAIDPML